MWFDDEFLSQECYVILNRKDIEQARPRSRRIVESIDSESDFNTPRMSSRPSRKRGSNEVEEPVVHTNKAKGGPLSVKKVKFGLNYDPDKDNLSFRPVNPERYITISTIIPPTYSDAVSDCCLFPLSKFQSKKINVDNYCVLLRLAYFNKQDGDYEDNFDYGMHIEINNIALPLIAPTYEDPNAPLDGPADITRYLIAEGASIEKIKIAFEGQAKPHIFSVVFCKKKQEELPFVALKYMEPGQTFKLAHKANERFMKDINKIFRKVYTLIDPISKQRINVPVRGINCAHVECFDKDSFLRAERRKLDWSCPICSNKITEDQLVVDGLFASVLAKTFSTCTAVELDSQGGFSPVYNNKVFRVRTVDLENGTSEGEEEEEEEEEMKSPEGPLSPVDVPPEPEEPETVESHEMNGMNGGGDEFNVSREAETQTQDWNDVFEVEKDDGTPMDADDRHQSEQEPESSYDASESRPTPTPPPQPSTVIQRIDDGLEMDDE